MHIFTAGFSETGTPEGIALQGELKTIVQTGETRVIGPNCIGVYCRTGQEGVDLSSLEEALLRLSGFVEKYPEIKELDLNPIFAYADGYVAVDARVVLEPAS